MKSSHTFLAVLILAIGVAVAGWFVGDGFARGRTTDRYVTVKGLSERDVEADLALWPIRFVSTDNSLAAAQKNSEMSRVKIMEFLKRFGIDAGQVELQELRVDDQMANPYRSGDTSSRYIITQVLMVRTTQPQLIQSASQKVGDLVEAGVVLSSSGGYRDGPSYLFSGLTELKPGMIAEATENARAAAQQFAKDSGSRLGKIMKANQGVFLILPRDRAEGVMEESQPHKTVRVVTTVDYTLAD
ncbi:MAG: SIMPL domain-containing protein [Candidatus Eisenbacteria bacterium]|uniref:SIMPL domain-containing protein n=1 Tax=Eiseniibacteriota bacterium TaxID=2212470 RepID=A0A948W841_UNCEI|nr:SIMPL domain-containing protein [Candidatus Eisenbacteria bacterium]MBU1948177.1 SIMPL domain-containing protein [Candidatus Eisenbacteria bacterium]MBU2692306.1 SIMPL domain-containing protein [Candidatus Eisenbacteria bacterium]